MNEREPDFSRVNRKKVRKRSNNVLNILIGIVLVLIIVVASIIFLGNDDEQQADENKITNIDRKTEPKTTDDEKQSEKPKVDENENIENDEADNELVDSTADTDKTESQGSVTYVQSDDEVVSETIVNSSWQPIGTTQTGEHTSIYEKKSIDWIEKQRALAYATGLQEDSMIIWKLKNGGSPQKSIGIVSSMDKKNNYRVYLEWIDEKGWLPVKMDILTTLDFNY